MAYPEYICCQSDNLDKFEFSGDVYDKLPYDKVGNPNFLRRVILILRTSERQKPRKRVLFGL